MNNNLNNNEKFKIIIEQLSTLSLYDLNLLILEIEKYFNIKVSNYSNLNAIPSLVAQNTTEIKEKEEKLTFNLTLQSVQSDKKISVLKVVRTITGLGLKESKDIVDNVPKLLKENISKDECEKIKKDIENAGGVVIYN